MVKERQGELYEKPEAIARGWFCIAERVDNEVKSVGIYRRLSDTAALYKKGEDALYRIPGLVIALDR